MFPSKINIQQNFELYAFLKHQKIFILSNKVVILTVPLYINFILTSLHSNYITTLLFSNLFITAETN